MRQKKSNEEDENNRKKKKTEKVYDLNSDKELNGDFGTSEHDDNGDNQNEEHITRENG